MRILLATALIALMPMAALAATPQTVVLDVQNMTCELCPVTVKKALEKVPGVSQARIDFAGTSASGAHNFNAPRAVTIATHDGT